MSNEKKRFVERIEHTTQRTIDEITKLVMDSHLTKHSEIRSFIIENLNLTYGDANTLTHYILKSDGQSLAEGKTLDQVLEEIYSDKKHDLLEIHQSIMKHVEAFGDFELLPKKGYFSLKRKRQFMMIGPKSNSRIELGINLKSEIKQDRFIPQPKGSMCQYLVRLSSKNEVDNELVDVLKQAYNESN